MYQQTKMMRKLNLRLVWLITLTIIVASACSQATTPQEPPPPTEKQATTALPTATETLVPPTEMPMATAAPTSTGAPAATDTPDPTPTATAPPTPTPIPAVQYRLTFESTWSADTHPTDFPRNPHFSGLIGGVHNANAVLWVEGSLASPGIKQMAETGGKKQLNNEVEALMAQGDACSVISGGGIGNSPGVVEVTFTANLDCPLVSVVTMIAPSPDWFVGVSGLNLLENGVWAEEITVDLLPYDAGTDSGSSYASGNAPTAAPETIYKIEVEPLLINGSVPSFGTFTFTLVGAAE